MIFTVEDWILDVDVAATREYSQKNLREHCECGYCRNFYGTIDGYASKLRPFLAQFGADVEAPVDFLPVEPTLCMVSFAVCGKITQKGTGAIDLGGCTLVVETQDTVDYKLSCPQPWFVFTTDYLELPWILDEDPDEVISPANEPECLERMWKKLLEKAPNTEIMS